MVTRYLYIAATSISLISATLSAQTFGNPTRNDLGVGAEALGAGNNYVAGAHGASALFANPAGLALTDRCSQFQLSFGGTRPLTEASTDAGLSFSASEQLTHMNISNVAYVVNTHGKRRAPAALGFAFQSPYTLDETVSYSGNYTSGGDQISYENQYLSNGSLNFWTAGLSFPIAQGFTTGASFSAITGEGVENLRYLKKTNGIIKDSIYDSYELSADRFYAGYDMRLGFLIEGSNNVSVGLMMELPSIISFNEQGVVSTPNAPTLRDETYQLNGYLKSYYTMSAGIAIDVKPMRLLAQVDGRAPYPRQTFSDPERYWKTGAGFGVEADLVPAVFKARVGYSWREYDPNPYIVTYEENVIEEVSTRTRSLSGEQSFSLGGSYAFNESVSMDFGYMQKHWKSRTEGALEESHQTQRFVGSLTFQY